MFLKQLLRKGVVRRLQPSFYRTVSVSVTGNDKETSSPFLQKIVIGDKHNLVSDEPLSVGGKDLGPSPYELLLASLGACTSMTLRMYAERKKIPLEGVVVELNHHKVYAKDCEACIHLEAAGSAKIDRIERIIMLSGGKLTETDRQNLLRIANLCPVHKTLESKSVISTSLKADKE